MTAAQPELALPAGRCADVPLRYLRAAWRRQPWRRRISFQRAIESPSLHKLLRNLAEIDARKRRP